MLKTGKFAALRNISALAILGALAINPVFAEEKSVAMVNGVSIPQSRVDKIVKNAVAQGQVDNPELRKNIRENLISREILLQEAKAKGFDKKPEVQEQIETARQEILMNSFLMDYAKNNPVSDDQIKQEYDKLKAKMGNKEYNARHILVETEAEAKDIIAQLGKKAKFEKLAEKSKDTGSAQRGGELGWAVPSTYVPEFSNAMLNLKKGEYTKQPVQSQFGWHVIRLDDMRDMKAPPFENVKPQLQQRMQQQSIQKAIGDLRAKAKIE